MQTRTDEAPQSETHVRYRADIDGLRAFAVLPVLFYHSGISFFSGGYVGVDIFFVISGYVITLSLLNDIRGGTFSIARFYERRARRILPAMLATIVVTGFFVVAFFYPPAIKDFFLTSAATATFTSNVYLWLTSNYFAVESQIRPLLHLWSLSVEEQFYIIVPVIFYFIARYGRFYWTALFGLALAISFCLSVVATQKAATFNFYMLPTRAWELLIGVMLAFGAVPLLRIKAFAEIAAYCGLIAIGYAVSQYHDDTPFPGVAALLPCIGAALIIYAGMSQRTWTARMLSLPPIVFLGRISYSLYLVHWPLIVVLKTIRLGVLSPVDTAVVITGSLILATVSYYLIEQPFRRPNSFGGRRAVLATAAAALLVAIGISAVGISTNGFAARYPDFDKMPRVTEGGPDWRTGSCFFGSPQSLKTWNADECTFGHGVKRVLLWGDSHAAHYIPGLELLDRNIDAKLSVYTMAACPPLITPFRKRSSGCETFNSRVPDIIRDQKIETVVLAARWISHPETVAGGLKATVAALTQLGVKVIVIGQSPIFGFNPYDIDYRLSGGKSTRQSWQNTIDDIYNARLSADLKGTPFINPEDSLCPQTRCLIKTDSQILFIDNAHFSRAGSALAVASYFPFVAGTGNRTVMR